MRTSAAAKQIQHVASLGIDSQVAIHEMLRVLAAIVPGTFNSFFWVDASGEPTGLYAPT